MNIAMISLIFLICLSLTTSALYFPLMYGHAKCFYEDVYGDKALMIKWKIVSSKKETNINEVLDNILISLSNGETKKHIEDYVPTEVKSKRVFNIPEEGRYLICIGYKASFRRPPRDIEMNIKVSTDIGVNYSSAIKSEDLEKVQKRLGSLKRLVNPAISKQKEEINLEQDSANETIKSINWYRKVTYIQIIVCVVVTFLHLRYFMKFLGNAHVI